MKDSFDTVNGWLKNQSINEAIHPTLDEDGTCSLQIGEDKIVLEVSRNFSFLYIHAHLLTLPEDDENLAFSLPIRALEINALPEVTAVGSIGAAPGCGFLIYRLSLPIEGTSSSQFDVTIDEILKKKIRTKKNDSWLILS